MPASQTAARVVLVSGPSGAGKSRLCRELARRHGWPVVRLDDFYKDADDPTLPMSGLGLPDWDDIRSWHADDAVTALAALVHDGATEVPEYSIAQSRCTGSTTQTCPPDAIVLAEGIFAAELVEPLRERHLLAEAWCVRRHPWITFALRLARDLHERRKPVRVLWQRGHWLRRLDHAIVARHVSLGALPVTPARARARADRLRAVQ